MTKKELDSIIYLLKTWVNINSHFRNPEGIKNMLAAVEEEFKLLNPDRSERIPTQTSSHLFFKKRPSAARQIFFGGHLDTVFPVDHPFQKADQIDEMTLKGPGVLDMKGGIVILLHTLKRLEASLWGKKVGWEVLLNTDEEDGSKESRPLLEACAKRVDLALLFEPALPGGALASARKGSFTYKAFCLGKSAHAGRDSSLGVNALFPLARFVAQVEKLQDKKKGAQINLGIMEGGVAANIVPNYAEATLNMRAWENQTLETIDQKMQTLARKEGVKLELLSSRPPKPFDAASEALFFKLKEVGKHLSIPIRWEKTGGVCDGNFFAAAGVPTIDTLGACGLGMHTDQEYIDLSSLEQRIQLTSNFLEAWCQK